MATTLGHLIKRVALFFVAPVLVISSLPVQTAGAAPTFQLPMRGNIRLTGYTSGIQDHRIDGPDQYAVDMVSDNPAVYPAAGGKIMVSDYNCATKKSTATSCYGNTVVIDHGSNYYSIYTHLACDDVFNNLVDGQPVTTSDRIGTMSNTGDNKSTCAAPSQGNEHLHFAVRSSTKKLSAGRVLFEGSSVNVWQYTSAGGTSWIPGLTWPQATADSNPWSISLSADKSQATAGEDVTLTAQVSANAVSSVPPFSVVVSEPSTGAVVQTCTTPTCVATVSQAAASTHTYRASIEYATTLSPTTVVTMATSNQVDATWNDPTWTHVPGGAATAFRVSVVNSNDVWAAGAQSVQHWNGANWQPVPYTIASTFIHDIKAFANDDVWVVGYWNNGTGTQESMTAHWDGTGWTRISSPNPGVSQALTSIDGMFPDQLWAVGGYGAGGGQPGQPLTMRWDGESWTTFSTPFLGFGGSFEAVSVHLPDEVWAVGSYDPAFGQQAQPLTARWNGSSWQFVAAPTVSTANWWRLVSVDALSPTDVWAVGSVVNSTPPPPTDLIEHWDGTNWQIVASPCPTTRCVLNDVMALAPDNVWAVGLWVDTDNTTNTLIKRWDGANWSIVPSPSPANQRNDLFGIAAATTTDIWALGRMNQNLGDPLQPLYLRYH